MQESVKMAHLQNPTEQHHTVSLTLQEVDALNVAVILTPGLEAHQQCTFICLQESGAHNYQADRFSPNLYM